MAETTWKDLLEERIPDVWLSDIDIFEKQMELCQQNKIPVRPHMTVTYPSFQERKRRYYALVDSDVLLMIKNGRLADAQACIEKITGIPPFSLETEDSDP